MPSTHIWPCGNTSHNLVRKAQHSHMTTNVRKAQHSHMTTNVRKAQHLHSTIRGTNPMYMSKGLCTYIWSCRNQSYNCLRMALYLHLIQSPQNSSALTSDHVGTNPTITSERHTQHSHLTMWEHISQPYQKGPALTSENDRNHSSHLC